eukprot:7316848-Prymnesium_polylepis.1
MQRTLSAQGDDVTLCWLTNTSASGSTVREACDGARVVFDTPLTGTLFARTHYDVNFTMRIPPARQPLVAIPHANTHSCLRRVGFCTPFVADTPTLATHSGEQLLAGCEQSTRGLLRPPPISRMCSAARQPRSRRRSTARTRSRSHRRSSSRTARTRSSRTRAG